MNKRSIDRLVLNATRVFLLAFALFVSGACARQVSARDRDSAPVEDGVPAEARAFPASVNAPNLGELYAGLEQIAEIERSGGFSPGMGLAESGLRERAGDFAGAAAAAYKELSRSYGYGGVSMEEMTEKLARALAELEENSSSGDSRRATGASALRGCLGFAGERWEEAESFLSGISGAEAEPDSFLRWMLLVCALENGKSSREEGRNLRSAYGAIRARYAFFPEYWYRGARAFAGGDADGGIFAGISAAYAEQCVNISPKGPFAAECRKIIFSRAGLSSVSPNDAYLGIRTKAEIESVIRISVEANDPQILEELFPLMSLPDNPYTVYAQSALKVLSSFPAFRDFFAGEAGNSSGRLEERLRYISRG